MKVFYTIYRTTNQINGKIYIGCHKTFDLNDGYLGSGKILSCSIEKYGEENFKKEILHVFDSAEEMFEMETILVNEEFVQSDDNYNLKIGGEGGWDHVNKNESLRVPKNKKAMLSAYENNILEKSTEALRYRYFNDLTFRETVKERLKNNKENIIDVLYPKGTFYGKTHSEETKSLMSRKAKERLKNPKNNSQFGTIWVYNELLKESKKIKKQELSEWLSKGWLKGRKMKW